MDENRVCEDLTAPCHLFLYNDKSFGWKSSINLSLYSDWFGRLLRRLMLDVNSEEVRFKEADGKNNGV